MPSGWLRGIWDLLFCCFILSVQCDPLIPCFLLTAEGWWAMLGRTVPHLAVPERNCANATVLFLSSDVPVLLLYSKYGTIPEEGVCACVFVCRCGCVWMWMVQMLSRQWLTGVSLSSPTVNRTFCLHCLHTAEGKNMKKLRSSSILLFNFRANNILIFFSSSLLKFPLRLWQFVNLWFLVFLYFVFCCCEGCFAPVADTSAVMR